ncbi:hypothetical protein LVJ94_08690 [Pendulispora rubella]|uniref:Uncharacterized protein n=1 Tax=Pendulispora rubella TaxID=2741070 RepID=A0ABZ2L8P1_9BACT
MRARTKRRWREIAGALACALLVLTVLSGTVQAGQRYFFCAAMGLMTSNPCRVQAVPDSEAERVTVQHMDCCETMTLPQVPDGARGEVPEIPAASIVAVVPVAPHGVEVSAPNIDASVRARWRVHVPPRPPNERRAQLMVFLT